MSLYRDRTSGNYVTLEMARASYPNIAVGSVLSTSDYNALNIDPVIQTAVPPTTLIQRAVRGAPVQNTSGDWETTYTVVDVTTTMSASQLATFKSKLADILSAQFDAQAAAAMAVGFQFNFSAYNTSTGISCATLTPNGTAGVLTIQMDTGSQINWLGVRAMANLAIQSCSYDVTALAIGTSGAGYTPGTGYALTATSTTGSGFAGTVDVSASGALTNPKITTPGSGYTDGLTLALPAAAGTPTTAGTITATVQQPAAITLRVYENYNVIVPAAEAIAVLLAAAQWKTKVVFAAAGLKDQAIAMAANNTSTAAEMLALTWTTPAFTA